MLKAVSSCALVARNVDKCDHELDLSCTHLTSEAQIYTGKTIEVFLMLEALFRHQTNHIDVFETLIQQMLE